MCGCGNAILCDEHGNHCMQKLGSHDTSWEMAVFRGVRRQVLSWKMDIEEPTTAGIISAALNKKNEHAMNTSRDACRTYMFRHAIPYPTPTVCDTLRDASCHRSRP